MPTGMTVSRFKFLMFPKYDVSISCLYFQGFFRYVLDRLIVILMHFHSMRRAKGQDGGDVPRYARARTNHRDGT